MRRLTGRLRALLKHPLGELMKEYVHVETRPLIVVGDATAAMLLRRGIVPDLIVYDRLEGRKPVDADTLQLIENVKGGEVVLRNPPGHLNDEAIDTIADALGKVRRVRIEGEDDLLTLAAIIACPEGGMVLYGQPGRGVVRIRVDRHAKALARYVIENMEVVECR